jgi:type II secretory pathway component PulF
MKEYWGFLLSALQDVLGKQLGQLVAWTFCIAVILAFVVPVVMMLRASTELRSETENEMDAIPGVDGTVNRKSRSRFAFSLSPSIKIDRGTPLGKHLTVKVSTSDPLVIKLDNDAVARAHSLLGAGSDIDSICREIEPAYADWQSVQQRAFQKAVEMLLKIR